MTAETGDRRPRQEAEPAGTLSDLATVRYLPDDAMVSVSAEFIDAPHVTYVSSLADLRGLIEETMAPYPAVHTRILLEQLKHEQEHAAAAAAVIDGCRSRFGLSAEPLRNGGTRWRPVYSWASPAPLMKLAIGAIVAAPFDVSPSDQAYLWAMGYRDARYVAERIRQFNRQARKPLPLPVTSR
jgi:hypothetical protein